MNVEYSYVGVPATIQEAMKKENRDYPVETSETLALAGQAPGAPKLSASTVVSPFMLSMIQNLTFWSQGMEISYNAHSNARA